MLEKNADAFLRLGQRIQDALVSFEIQSSVDSENSISDEDKDDLRDDLKEMAGLCAELDMPVSGALLERALSNLPETSREMELLKEAMRNELRSKLFLFVPPHLSSYYENEGVLSEDAGIAFPSTKGQLRHAGNCLAYGESLACVFHCMNALEYGLAALANNVGEAVGVDTWQNVIDRIDKAIKDVGTTQPKSAAKNDRLQFLSEAANEFRCFKDGWRNYVSHNKISYGEALAIKIFDHVRAFIEHLSKEICEQRA